MYYHCNYCYCNCFDCHYCRERDREGELHLARVTGVVTHLQPLCSAGLTSTSAGSAAATSSIPPLALACLLSTLHLAENRDFVLCASSGGAVLADCLAWALSSRAVTAAGVTQTSVIQTTVSQGAEQQQSALGQLASPQRQQKRDGSSGASTAKQSDAAAADSAGAVSSGSSSSSNVLEALLGRAAAAVLAPSASCLSLLLRHVPRSEVRAVIETTDMH
jgi:hypothetical protein